MKEAKTEARLTREKHVFETFLKGKRLKKKFEERQIQHEMVEGYFVSMQERNPAKRWIELGIIWRHTPEGFLFWQKINNEWHKFLTKHKL